MRLTASDIYSYYRPSRCALRPYLRHKEVAETEPGAYMQLLIRLGERHEQLHLASLGAFADLRAGSIEDRQA